MGRLEKCVYSDARNPEKQVLMIRFLQNSEIDRLAWDACINNSGVNLVYGLSWYLDLVSPGWCGLAEDDYVAVMPLPVKKKYGISYIMQPLYVQQLGVFSQNELTQEKTEEFVNAIPGHCRYIALNFNYSNQLRTGFFSQSLNSNFELALDPLYEYIEEGYSSNTRRNLQKAVGLNIRFDGTADELIELKIQNTGANRRRIPPQQIRNLVSSIMDRGSGFICTASLNEKICAAVFFIHHQKRIYYLIPVSNPTGKEKKAMFAIIDVIIQKFAGSSMVLDFEGSNIPGLARFFEGFGAENRQYPTLIVNRLPFPLNLFRKK
jgi:hypothetical protein